uniref:SWIM-type domain-containing protein n=1 Tax=Ciona savignyi TaxID=51511 RepID=H2YMA1_CIOSA
MYDVPSLLMQLRSYAECKTMQECESAMTRLTSHPAWEANKKLQHWFNTTWLRSKEKWVWAYRPNTIQILINMRNGVELQTQQFQHEMLMNQRQLTIGEMSSLLVDEFLPQLYNRYIECNVMSRTETVECLNDIPEYLRNRPHEFTLHCLQNMLVARDIPHAGIKKVDEKTYRVNSLCGLPAFIVFIGSDSEFPSCQCHVWTSTWWPCPHLLALCEHKVIQWHQLSSLYRSLSFTKIDLGLMGKVDSRKYINLHSDLPHESEKPHKPTQVKLQNLNSSIDNLNKTTNAFKETSDHWEIMIFEE